MTIRRVADKFALRAMPCATFGNLRVAMPSAPFCSVLLQPEGPSGTQRILASDLSRLILLVLNAGQVATGNWQLASWKWQVESSKWQVPTGKTTNFGRRDDERLAVLYFFKAKNTACGDGENGPFGCQRSRRGWHGLCALHACNVQKRRLMPH